MNQLFRNCPVAKYKTPGKAMSEETQKPEEHKEDVAPQQPETTPEATAEEAEATTEETAPEAQEAAVPRPVEILTERPALAEPGDFDWDSFETDTDDY